MSNTLNQLVRNQILAEGPDISSMHGYVSQIAYDAACAEYIDEQLNSMTNVELLQRISDAQETLAKQALDQVKHWL
jgi:hypothetical protein